MSQGRPRLGPLLRHCLAVVAGLAVVSMLGGVSGAQTPCVTTTPQTYSPPGCQFGTTATSVSTATSTLTPIPGTSPTATPTTAPSTAQQTGPGVIMGGRGRITNVRQGSFTVVWTTDTEVVGQVNWGSTSALGNTATDTRGAGFAGQTHYVDVIGLTADATYFFDVVSGGQVDSNGGQHYQVKTAPVVAGATQGNRAQGTVLNPGGVSPAGGAVVWGNVKDNNGQGSTGSSQLLSALAGSDGRFSLDLNARTVDLTQPFTYQNAGDQVELTARAGQGEAVLIADTSTTYGGGTASQDVRLVLQPVAGATATPTFTPVPGAAPTLVPTPTVAAPLAVATATTFPGVIPPTPLPPPFPIATPTPPPVQLPVQLPTLKEMLLAQMGFDPATPTAVALAQAGPATAQPLQPAPPGLAPGAPPLPTATPPGGAPVKPPVGVGVPTVVGQLPAPAGQPGVPANPAVGPSTAPPSAAPTGSQGGVRSGPVAPPVPAPAVGTPFGRGATPIGAPAVSAPRPAVPTPTAASAFAGLSTMPAQVSLLFYGGVILALAGAGIGIYSVLSGAGWRPR